MSRNKFLILKNNVDVCGKVVVIFDQFLFIVTMTIFVKIWSETGFFDIFVRNIFVQFLQEL